MAAFSGEKRGSATTDMGTTSSFSKDMSNIGKLAFVPAGFFNEVR
jgi:hypothetical protein